LRHADERIEQAGRLGDLQQAHPQRDAADEAEGDGDRRLGEVERRRRDGIQLHPAYRAERHRRGRLRSPGREGQRADGAAQVVVPARRHRADRGEGFGDGGVFGEAKLPPVGGLDQRAGVAVRGARGHTVEGAVTVGIEADLDALAARFGLVAVGERHRHRERLPVAVGVVGEVADVGDQGKDQANDDQPAPDVVQHAKPRFLVIRAAAKSRIFPDRGKRIAGSASFLLLCTGIERQDDSGGLSG
jgi:hypothetical protein